MSRQVTIAAVLAVMCVLGCFAPSQAAVSCAISASGVRFGNYDVFNAAATLSNGTVTYRCTGFVTGSGPVTIFLSRGNSPTFNPRFMRRGAQQLNYNLYLDAGLTMIWGDGTGGTSIYGPVVTVNDRRVTVTVFGSVPPGQDVTVGRYTDSITATINF